VLLCVLFLLVVSSPGVWVQAAKSNKPPPAVIVKSGRERVGTGNASLKHIYVCCCCCYTVDYAEADSSLRMITHVAVGQGASMPWMRSFYWQSSKKFPFAIGLPVPHPCVRVGDLSVTTSHSGPKLSSQTLLLLFLAIS